MFGLRDQILEMTRPVIFFTGSNHENLYVTTAKLTTGRNFGNLNTQGGSEPSPSFPLHVYDDDLNHRFKITPARQVIRMKLRSYLYVN